jgi:hypothetical protein
VNHFSARPSELPTYTPMPKARPYGESAYMAAAGRSARANAKSPPATASATAPARIVMRVLIRISLPP